MRAFKPKRGWIKIPILAGGFDAAAKERLLELAENTAAFYNATIVKNWGERAELIDGVWHRFCLYQVERSQ